MNNTLYEITDKYLKVLDNLEIDEETGEIPVSYTHLTLPTNSLV